MTATASRPLDKLLADAVDTVAVPGAATGGGAPSAPPRWFSGR